MKLRQPLKGAAEALYEYATETPVIDTHEHIPLSEKHYNERTIRFGDMFTPYVTNDLWSAGMPFPEGAAPAFACIEQHWDAFEPYWRLVKHGSYARAFRIALQKFYGVDDLTRENHAEIVRKANEDNAPGIFKRIFNDACGIEKSVVCSGALPDRDDPLLVGNIVAPSMQITSKQAMDGLVGKVDGASVRTLDDLVEVMGRWMEMQAADGAIEFKTRAIPVERPNRDKAAAAFSSMVAGVAFSTDESNQFCTYMREADAKKAAELDLPMAIHTGVWGDFRDLSVSDLIGFIGRNPATKMDIYHLGIPEVRAAVQVVKNFPNAYLNLCWAHVVASDMVVATLKEAMDVIPMNKVFAFGADYILFVEKVYGHLQMARENVAIVLGDRVDRNLMDLSEAKEVLRMWFYDNPKEFYRL